MRGFFGRASARGQIESRHIPRQKASIRERLRPHGFKETEASITMKLKRGTFPATFFLACLAAL